MNKTYYQRGRQRRFGTGSLYKSLEKCRKIQGTRFFFGVDKDNCKKCIKRLPEIFLQKITPTMKPPHAPLFSASSILRIEPPITKAIAIANMTQTEK